MDRSTRFATTALMSAGLGLVAVGFGAGVANAQPYERCHGCPGDGPVARRKWRADCGIGIRAVPQCHSKNPPSAPSESQHMVIKRPKHWVLGIAMALAIAYFTSIAAADHENPELIL